MGDFSMTVLMGMRVGMFMRVLKLECVFNHIIGAYNHHNQSGVE